LANWIEAEWGVGQVLLPDILSYYFFLELYVILVRVTRWWIDTLLDWLQRVLEVAFYGFACLGILGASTLVAFTADVVQVATLHFHMCHVIATTVVYGLRLFTSTLWNLFQGKCYNRLCNRNDKWFYEMDHLVLGTIFFTLATFLIPTIFIYQVFFCIIDSLLYLSLSVLDSFYCDSP